jgi:hypothetical protein
MIGMNRLYRRGIGIVVKKAVREGGDLDET